MCMHAWAWSMDWRCRYEDAVRYFEGSSYVEMWLRDDLVHLIADTQICT